MRTTMMLSDFDTANRQIFEVQIGFAELIANHFYDLWQRYKETELSAERTVAYFLSDSSSIVVPGRFGLTTALFKRIEDLLMDIDRFWQQETEKLRNAIFQTNRLGILVGDIDAVSDYYAESILQLGLYFDNLYLIEPLSVATQRIKQNPQLLEGEEYTLTVIRLLTGFLHIRELLEQLAPSPDTLISVFVPIMGMNWGDAVFDRIFGVATEHTNILLSSVFEQEIRRPTDLVKHTKKLPLKEFEKRLRSDPVLSTMLHGFRDYTEYIDAHRVDLSSTLDKLQRSYVGESAIYFPVYPFIQARMLSLESAEVFAKTLSTDAATQSDDYPFNVYRVKRNLECGQRLGLHEAEIAAHALLEGTLEWFLPESLSQLRSFREVHQLEKLRELFRVSHRTLQQAEASDRQAAAEEMIRTVYGAIQDALKELEKSRQRGLKSFGLNVLKVVGSFGLAVVTTVLNIPLSLAIPIAALVPTYSVWDFSAAEKETYEHDLEVQKKPAFILINFAKKRELNRVHPLLHDGRRISDLLDE